MLEAQLEGDRAAALVRRVVPRQPTENGSEPLPSNNTEGTTLHRVTIDRTKAGRFHKITRPFSVRIAYGTHSA